MGTHTRLLLILLIVLVICLSTQQVAAFGAGNIPSFAYLEGKAFRHGDIEDVLAEIVKRGGGGGFSLGSLVGKGSKFGGLDIKRVYFGNWLRDYSQAVDVAALKKLQLQTILNLCMALGFLAHGYATAEFEVTPERLGCYLPVEHIDNPKGYADGEDARKYHKGLRGPIDPRELEVDPRTGMKNYIANTDGSWDTSKAHVRRLLEKCIHLGRQARSNGRKEDEYEALRLLGTLMHTLEDFPAHSNFCELALVNMGYTDVFVHVGDHVRIRSPQGRQVAPLVTGTFGGADFFYSLLGEAGDKISSASVSDLNAEVERAVARSRSGGPGGSGPSNPADVLRNLLFSIPGGGGSDMARDLDAMERIRAGPGAGGKNPEEMSPQELYQTMWQILVFRDGIVKKIEATIEKIPGLGPLIEKLMDSIAVFIYTTLEPFLKPIMKSASSGLSAASTEVIDSHDQYEVFNDPRASDPTHSFLSKDHFNSILNEPAGMLAQVIVRNTVALVVKAWDDVSVQVSSVAEEVTQCLFHPDFHSHGSKVQREMLQCMKDWVKSLGHNEREIIHRLNKENVRAQKNVRLGGEGGTPHAHGTAAHNAGLQASANLQGYVAGLPGVAQAQNFFGSVNKYTAPAGPPPGFNRQVSGTGDPSSTMPGSFGMPSVPGQSTSTASPGVSSYGAPPGPPPSWGGEGASSSPFSAPPAPPPHAGYSPSYASAPLPYSGPPGGPGGFGPPPGPPPAGFPSPPGPGGFGFPSPSPTAPGFAPLGGGPPGFPGPPSPFGVPGGPPPFPGGPPPPGGHHHHHHHHGSQSGYPGASYNSGGW